MQVTPSESSQQSSIKLLQITDTHLFAAENGRLLSVQTLKSFQAVVNEVLVRQVDFDFIIATGDISQDHSAASYQWFVDGIKPLKKDCFWLPGNHDDKPNMVSVLPTEQIKELEHVLLGEHWQMIMLDSQVVGVPHGRLSENQLAFLQQKLAEYPQRYTLVLLHHHPLLVGSAWLDQHCLKDADDFWKIIQSAPHVQGVVCGHVHQDKTFDYHGVKVISTPSTCVQFEPDSHDFALGSMPPGWRELELHADGRLSTRVQRLAEGTFMPDFSSDGY